MRRFGELILLSADVLLLIACVVGWAGKYVHPRHAFWMQPLATILPALTLLLLGATPFLWMTRQRGALAAHLAVGLLLLWRFAPLDWLRRSAPASDELRLITLNAKPKTNYPGAELALLDLARAFQADLVSMQEIGVVLSADPRYLGTASLVQPLLHLGGYRVWRPAVISDSLYHTSLPVLGNGVDSPEVTVPELIAGGDARSFLTRAECSWRGRRIALYNIHLRSFETSVYLRSSTWWQSLSGWRALWRQLREDYIVRAAQAEAVRRLLDEERLPFVVSGDFNSSPHNWAYSHIARGYTDAFSVAGRSWGATYHARFPIFRIDHVVVSPEWRVSSARVGDRLFSDHLPLLVRLHLSL